MGIFDIFKKKGRGGEIEYSCAKCGIKWDKEKMEMLFGGPGRAVGMVTPGSEGYAGRCPKCGKLYCAKCAILSGVTFQCPKCKATLKTSLHGF